MTASPAVNFAAQEVLECPAIAVLILTKKPDVIRGNRHGY